MKNTILILAVFCGSMANICLSETDSAPAASNPSDEPVVLLPKMTITAKKGDVSLRIPPHDVTEATFAKGDPVVGFPAQARFKRVFDGSAAVGVMVDAEGKATDFLVVRYSEPYFAEEVMKAIRDEHFTPRKIKGVAVPGRFYVVRTFSLDNRNETGSVNFDTFPTTVAMSLMEHMEERTNRIVNKDGPPMIYKAHAEYETDGHLLKFAAVAAPALPADFEIPAGGSVKIVVSFYVDEDGNVRLPNIESNASPAVMAKVVEAVAGWKFERPKVGGKPALVFTHRMLIFEVPSRSTVR